MVKGRRTDREPVPRRGACTGARIGTVLLDLRDAIRYAQQCRRTLKDLGVSRKKWLEIVQDIDPGLRFLARPQMLDEIATLLEEAGKPLGREALVQELLAQGAGSSRHIRNCIHAYLNNGNLTLYQGDKIGLPEWV